ncbi:MAG: NAD-dependent epimerase/dehydratase family protein, partial [Bacteroidales bacterium]
MHFFTRGQKVISVPRKVLYEKPELEKFLEEVDVIIHLAGTPITKRWTMHNHKKMFNSRVITTQNIAHVIDNMQNPPNLFISTSAIGIYNNIHYHDESSNDFSDNFLGTLCKAWEAPVKSIKTDKTRTIITRLGIVLGDGGMLSRLSWSFKMGLGAKIGHGEYPMPLIHIDDLLAFYETAINDAGYQGI